MEEQSYFTLHFNETGNAQVKKQVFNSGQFRSKTHNEVQSEVPDICYVGTCKSRGCCERNAWCLEKLAIPLRLMLSLGMDEPNVNKSRIHKINQVKKEKGYQPLVKCPSTCSIHICHNSFQKCMAQYGNNAEELCLNLYYFFKRSSCR